jgi:hypothetical protein
VLHLEEKNSGVRLDVEAALVGDSGEQIDPGELRRHVVNADGFVLSLFFLETGLNFRACAALGSAGGAGINASRFQDHAARGHDRRITGKPVEAMQAEQMARDACVECFHPQSHWFSTASKLTP